MCKSRWVWGEHGFLRNLGVVDIAGSGPVHMLGGASGKFNIQYRQIVL